MCARGVEVKDKLSKSVLASSPTRGSQRLKTVARLGDKHRGHAPLWGAEGGSCPTFFLFLPHIRQGLIGAFSVSQTGMELSHLALNSKPSSCLCLLNAVYLDL